MEEAIGDLNQAIAIAPDQANAYVLRGQVQMNKNEFALAEQDFTKALEIDQNLPNAYLNRAISYVELGQNDKAIADANKVLEISTDEELKKTAQDILAEITKTTPTP